jgi:hypothetical protein
MDSCSKKRDLLCKLHELEVRGVKLSHHYTMNSNLMEMECEYEIHKRRLGSKYDKMVLDAVLMLPELTLLQP